MPDDAPPVPPPLDPGEPRFAWFDGIVEGRLGDASLVRDAASRANAAGFGRMDVGVDGGRFSVLMSEDTVGARSMTDENRRLFANTLAEIAAASAGPVESTLRCTEVFRNEVRETLFLAEGASIRALTRTRPVTEADLFRNPDGGPPRESSMGRGRLAVVLALLLVAFGAVAYFGGWVDRVLAARAESLSVDTGPFADYVDVSVEKSWGVYEVTLRRGKGFPVENARIEQLKAKAVTPADRAALDVVATGGKLWLRLEDTQGNGLAATSCELRPLLAGDDRTVVEHLPGYMSAARVKLSLDKGRELEDR
jgi:hypothetical protein